MPYAIRASARLTEPRASARPGRTAATRRAKNLARQAARTVSRNFSISSLSRLLSLASDLAEPSTCAEALPVSAAPRLTSAMLLATWLVPLAACWTLRAISWVAAPCSSTAAAIDPAISEMRPMVPPISLMAATDSCGRGLHAGDLRADLVGRLGGLGGQRLDLLGDHREALAGLAGARRLDGGVERQQVGLLGDRGDQLDHVADPAAPRATAR